MLASRDAICAFCCSGDETERLFNVSVCSDRCSVTIHKSCFDSRKSEPYWKKKHASRGNGDAELCCVPNCMAKLSKIRFKDVNSKEHELSGKSKKNSTMQTFEGQCCFYANNGLPCRRVAIKDGACSLHTNKAVLLKEMVEKSEDVTAKNGHADAASNTDFISMKSVHTNTQKVMNKTTEVQTTMTPMSDAETQTESHGDTRWNGAQICENVSLKKVSNELKQELDIAREEIHTLKLQLEHANEQSKIASMAYKTMEHDYSDHSFIME